MRGTVIKLTSRLSRYGLPGPEPPRRLMARVAFHLGGSVKSMNARVAFRLALCLGGLVLAATLLLAMMAVLSSAGRPGTTPVASQDQVAAVRRAVEAPAERARDGSSSPAVVLVFAGIVLLAALPPVHRVHVHHRSYQRSDWI